MSIEIRSWGGSIITIPGEMSRADAQRFKQRYERGLPLPDQPSMNFLVDEGTARPIRPDPTRVTGGRARPAIIRGESETIDARRPRGQRRSPRQNFIAWWCSHASDFARGGSTA